MGEPKHGYFSRGETKMLNNPDGAWVRRADYAALSARVAELEAQHIDFVVSALAQSREECQAAGPRSESDDFLAHVKKLRARAEATESSLSTARAEGVRDGMERAAMIAEGLHSTTRTNGLSGYFGNVQDAIRAAAEDIK